MSETPSELAAAKREIDRLRAENFGLKRSLAERERQIGDLLSTTSWRITAPLRTLVNALRKRRLLRRTPAPRGRGVTFEIERHEYQRWVQSYSSVDAEMREDLASAVEALAVRPLISVIMPSYNIDPKWMREAIESVRRQIYPHWELCISDDASTLAGVRELIESCAAQDKRIRVTFRATNGHISANSNTALDLPAAPTSRCSMPTTCSPKTRCSGSRTRSRAIRKST
jgi:cellulose synthase/poly-beta-1,6-N-acetylglucosamine synthase-like glycosyltransferase